MAFAEEQKINHFWMKVVYAAASLAGLLLTAGAVIKEGKMENLLFVLGMAIFLAAVFLLVFNSKAETRIDSVGISYKYKPFVWNWKTIAWKDIEKLELKKINPLNDYGGYGYRFSTRGRGIILNDTALIITSKKAKPFALSTNKSEQMRNEIAHRNADLLL